MRPDLSPALTQQCGNAWSVKSIYRFLDKKMYKNHGLLGLTVVPNSGQPLRGRSREQNLDYLHRSHWFRYVDDAWVKIRTREVETFR